MPASVSLWVIAEALLCAIVVVNNFGSCLCESLAPRVYSNKKRVSNSL